MGKENLVSLNITPADMQEIRSAITTLELKLLPYLLEISNQEKKELPKMKDKTVAFVTKATEHAEQNPQLVPPFISVEELRKDLEAVETLRKVLNPLEKICKSVDDTMLVAGSEAYKSALAFYNSVKAGQRLNASGAKEVYDDLKVQFEKSFAKKSK
jgi:secreted Zn-dependent insulinase-like peptidase